MTIQALQDITQRRTLPFQTFLEVLDHRVQQQPDQAYYFVRDDESEPEVLDYSTLWSRAQTIAGALQAAGASGERVLLFCRPGRHYIEALFGCFCAGAIAVPVLPSHRKAQIDRVDGIIADCSPRFALYAESMPSRIKALGLDQLRDIVQINIERLDPEMSTRWSPPNISGHAIALLQYTSGSTAAPRGIMVSHANLIENSVTICRSFGMDEKTRGVSWLPPYHDMGLIGCILQPLYAGFPIWLMQPHTFLRRPKAWLELISQVRATVSGGPNFAYDLCVRRIPEKERQDLDLSSWKVAFCGAEPVRLATIESFAEAFRASGFRRQALYPCYGLAEATLFVSGSPEAGPHAVELDASALAFGRVVEEEFASQHSSSLVSCGSPALEQQVFIVDPVERTECAPDEVGEIWVRGANVASGYWNRPEETKTVFQAFVEGTDRGPFLRTGDLGFLHEQELFIAGRLKDVLIIRGRNYYPQDIEIAVEKCHSALQPSAAAAFLHEHHGVGGVGLAIEVKPQMARAFTKETGDLVLAAVRYTLAEIYDLKLSALALLRPGAIPKTPSSKVQRYLCRDGFGSGTLDCLWSWSAEEPSVPDVAPPGSLPPRERKVDEIEQWLARHIAARLKIPLLTIDHNLTFTHYGLDSLEAVSLAAELEQWLGRPVDSTLAWDYPTISSLAHYLGTEEAVRIEVPSDEESTLSEPIAIIGMACRVPGARDADALWRVLRDGIDPIQEVPSFRWDINQYYDSTPGAPGKMYSRQGGFLEGVELFDPRFFAISPREAGRMDPQQRILIETVWETMEDAGIPPKSLASSKTGVFVGIGGVDYSHREIRSFNYEYQIDAYSGTGNAHSIAANRISYLFDFRGPSLAIDTACSSSLVATHLAVESLRRGECSTAFAGGVNLLLSPLVSIAFSQARMLAPDGRCKSFDASADGYVRSEGCGMVLLKRLRDALRDKDHIHGVIRGSAVNQDGRTGGITAPNGAAQQSVVLSALEQAGVAPGQIGLIEAHGTGTVLGDRIELNALSAIFGGRPPDEKCFLGSVKSNIGHLETSSGVAGLIKILLCFRHGQVPGQLHLQALNPALDPQSSPFIVPRQTVEWRAKSSPRFAGLSSFGFGGTNAHIVLEEPPALPREEMVPLPQRPVHVLAISARSDDILTEYAGRLHAHLREYPDAALSDVCYTMNTGRAEFAHRAALVISSREEALVALESLKEGRPDRRVIDSRPPRTSRPKIAFLFTGQGSQYARMGQALYQSQPVFRQALDRCEEIAKPILGRSLLAILSAAEGSDEARYLNATEFTQPSLFAIEYALSQLWLSWGIRPDALLGHSVGEYVAACVAGVFSLEEGLSLICERARLMQRLPQDGAMASISASADRVRQVLEHHPESTVIAAINGPENTVISGSRDAVLRVVEEFKAAGAEASVLPVSHAFHSPLIEPMLNDFTRYAASIEYGPPCIPLVSNVSGEIFEDGRRPDANYWRQHARNPVLFESGIHALLKADIDTFLEIGPTPTLISLGRHSAASEKCVWLPSLKQSRDDWQGMLLSLARLYASGADVDWTGFDSPYDRRRISLPAYPFARERFWFSEDESAGPVPTASPRALSSRGLSSIVPVAGCALPSFEVRLSANDPPYLSDHVVRDMLLLPATAFIEMAASAAGFAHPGSSVSLFDIRLHNPLMLDARPHVVQLFLVPDDSGEKRVQILSRRSDAAHSESWTLHVTGGARTAESVESTMPEAGLLEEVQARCRERLSSRELYLELAAHGLRYGSAFQGVSEIWRCDGEALGTVNVPAQLRQERTEYLFHPAVLDACLHVITGALPTLWSWGSGGGCFVPISVQRIRFFSRPGTHLRVHARLKESQVQTGSIECDLRIFSDSSHLVAELSGLMLQNIASFGGDKSAGDSDGWLHEVVWEIQPHSDKESLRNPPATHSALIYMDKRGSGASLVDQLRRLGTQCTVVHANESWAGVSEEFQDVIYLRSLDALSDNRFDLSHAHSLGIKPVLTLVQGLASTSRSAPPRLWLVTAGAQNAGGAEAVYGLSQSPLWGLGRVIAKEHPNLHCTLVDLSPTFDVAEIDAFVRELFAGSSEDQIALRGASRLVARLKRLGNAETVTVPVTDLPAINGNDQNSVVYLDIGKTGSLDSFKFRTVGRRSLREGEVEIRVEAAALNFRDVMKTLGIYPTEPGAETWLGDECAGRITGVGPGVEGIAVGDEVIAVGPRSFGSYTYTSSHFVASKPSTLTFQEAASLPIAFTTAYHGLCEVARLERGESVLIHAAAGGVGLAAVQIAQWKGAEIYATAGSAEKREYLRKLGLRHIFDSRTLDFSERILDLTSGRGVDVVLNSLSGEAIPKSLATLAPLGRFVEIGKRDIYENARLSLKPFQKSISFTAVDMERTFREQPQYASRLLRNVVQLFNDQSIAAVPHREFQINAAAEAFRYMAQRKNIGKIVLSMSLLRQDNAPALINIDREAQESTHLFVTNGCYLITGGTGGIGVSLAKWMISEGASQLFLMSRRPPGPEVTELANGSTGVTIKWVQGDVSDRQAVSAALSEIDHHGKPLRGIMHAAGVLDDSMLVNLNAERLNTVLRPKVQGAWNLHQLTADRKLDFFVLFSSAASVLGSPGQGSYSAANAFLDSLAHYRRAAGLSALAINWGPWLGAGMAEGEEQQARFERLGILPLTRGQALRYLRRALRTDTAQLAVFSADWERLKRTFDAAGSSNMISGLASAKGPRGASASNRNLVRQIFAADPAERQHILEGHLQTQFARIVGLDVAEVDVNQSLSSLGFDSLLGLELMFVVESGLGVKIPMEGLNEEATLGKIAALLLQVLPEPEIEDAHEDTPTIEKATTEASSYSVDTPHPQDAALMPREQLPTPSHLPALGDAKDYGTYVRPLFARILTAVKMDKRYVWASGDRMAYEEGNSLTEVIDVLGGYGSTVFGHNHPELIAHAQDLLERRLPIHAQSSNRQASGTLGKALSDYLLAFTGAEFTTVLANSGTEAVEAALKHAILEYVTRVAAHKRRGARGFGLVAHDLRNGASTLKDDLTSQFTQLFGDGEFADLSGIYNRISEHNQEVREAAPLLIAIEGSFHGKTAGSLSITWSQHFREAFGLLGQPRVIWIRPGDVEQLRSTVADQVRDTYAIRKTPGGRLEIVKQPWCGVAAIIAEPVQGEGGIHVLPSEFLAEAYALAERHDFPFILDEVQSGMGRCGSLLASQKLGVLAHYYVLGKSLGGGLTKISAALVRRDRYQEEFGVLHTSTFAEDDYSSSIALKALKLLERDDLGSRAAASGGYLVARLTELSRQYPEVISAVRGLGLMIGVELKSQQNSPSEVIRITSNQEVLGILSAAYLLNRCRIRIGTTLSSPYTLRIEPSAYLSRPDQDKIISAIGQLCEAIKSNNASDLAGFISDAQPTTPTQPVRWRLTDATPAREVKEAATKVAFIGHFIDEDHLSSWDPSMSDLSPQERHTFLERVYEVFKPSITRTATIVSKTGKAVELQFISLMSSSKLIEDALRRGDTRKLVQQVEEAIDQARLSGCRLVGLGGYLSIITQNGKKTATDGMAITTGNSFTVAMGIEGLRRSAMERQIDLGTSHLGAVGAAGNICSVYVRMMAEDVPRLLLVGRSASEERLRAIGATLYSDAWSRITSLPPDQCRGLAKSLLHSRAAERLAKMTAPPADTGRWLMDEIDRELGAEAFVRCSRELKDLKQCNLIVSASNSSDAIILPEHLSSGNVLICDISVPPDVSEAVTKMRPDVGVVRGGIVRMPDCAEFSVPEVRLPPGHLFACMAETVLLGLEDYQENFSFGEINRHDVDWISKVGRKHGFELGYLVSKSTF